MSVKITPKPVDEDIISLLDTLADDYTPVDLAPAMPELRHEAPGIPVLGQGQTRYIEGKTIGSGGLGEVIEAFDQDLRRRVALKRLHSELMQSAHIARLIEEAQITAQLDHPNIPSVHSLGIDQSGRPYFTMTRIEGMSLGQLLVARKEDDAVATDFGTARLLRIFLQVGYALAFAHDHGVLHRDIKPDNVMLGKFGEVRLMDWGIAKILAREQRGEAAADANDQLGPESGRPISVQTSVRHPKSVVGRIVGTPAYMSPEQARGDLDLDARTDVYALGALLYEVLSGEKPVRGATPADRMRATLDAAIVPLEHANPAVATPLVSVVHRALAFDAERRYPTVLDMVHDIENFLEGRHLRVESEGLLKRAGRAYVSRTARSSRLRFIDVDTLAASSSIIGIAIGAWVAKWLTGFEWLVLVVGLLVGIPFYYTWYRRPRPNDPNVKALREGVSRSFSPNNSDTPKRKRPERGDDPQAPTVELE